MFQSLFPFLSFKIQLSFLLWFGVLLVEDQRDHSSDVHQMLCCFVPITTCIYCLFLSLTPSEKSKSFLYNNVFDLEVTAHRWLEKRHQDTYSISTTEIIHVTLCLRCPLHVFHVCFPSAIRSSPCNTVWLATSSWWFLVMHRPKCWTVMASMSWSVWRETSTLWIWPTPRYAKVVLTYTVQTISIWTV